MLLIEKSLYEHPLMQIYTHEIEQCISERFDSCDRPTNFIQIEFKSLFFSSSFVHYFKATSEFKVLPSGKFKFGSKSVIFVPGDLAIRQITLTNNRAPLLTYFKLCASFCSRSYTNLLTCSLSNSVLRYVSPYRLVYIINNRYNICLFLCSPLWMYAYFNTHCCFVT